MLYTRWREDGLPVNYSKERRSTNEKDVATEIQLNENVEFIKRRELQIIWRKNMKKKINIALVAPKFIDAEDAQNYHLFEGHYNPITKQFVQSGKASCCGKCRCTSSSEYARISYLDCTCEEARKKAREVVKRFEDNGKRVCGQCVATLYSDDI